eukprot:UN14295
MLFHFQSWKQKFRNILFFPAKSGDYIEAEAKWHGSLPTPIYFVNFERPEDFTFPLFCAGSWTTLSRTTLLLTDAPVLLVQTFIQKWLSFHIKHMGSSYDQNRRHASLPRH